jgi:hypothetical protein
MGDENRGNTGFGWGFFAGGAVVLLPILAALAPWASTRFLVGILEPPCYRITSPHIPEPLPPPSKAGVEQAECTAPIQESQSYSLHDSGWLILIERIAKDGDSDMIEVIVCPHCNHGFIAPESGSAQVSCPMCGLAWELSSRRSKPISDAKPGDAVVVDAFGETWTAAEILANEG